MKVLKNVRANNVCERQENSVKARVRAERNSPMEGKFNLIKLIRTQERLSFERNTGHCPNKERKIGKDA